MKGGWRSVALLLAVSLATGCSAMTGGDARQAGIAPQPLTGSAIKEALLDGAALSKLLKQPFQTVPSFPSVFGGSEILDDDYGSASPVDCVGVVFAAQESTYQSATGKTDVRNVAIESWQHDGHSVKVDEVVESVVSLPTAADAAALFARLPARWKKCDGTTLTVPSETYVRDTITDVRVADSVVAATVSLGPGAHSVLAPVPKARAIGVQGNCLVDVAVTFFGNAYQADRGSGDIDTSAVDVAHAIMDRIGAPT